MPMQIIYASIFGTALLLPAQMTERTVTTNYLACNPERQFERAERLRATGDSKGLQAFTAGALLSGTCVSLTPGSRVFSMGSGKGPGIIRIRPKGSFKPFFTSELAFE
jgi:hypothetical protein